MRLLVCTQAVDLDDRALGFFHRWLEEMARQFESVEVICLREGRHSLPANVRVHSLGKEGGASRLKYVGRFYRYAFALRREYDAVFVHMNQEYALMGGALWKLFKKRVALWRNHKMGSLLTDIACWLSDVVCYTSPDSYVAKKPRSLQMPIGIDTRQFAPPAAQPASDSILFLGRFDEVKKVEEFAQALVLLAERGVAFHADVVGSPTDPASIYPAQVKALLAECARTGSVRFLPGVAHADVPGFYSSHAIYVNTTPSGSFDKTIGEACASGAIPVVANAAIRGVVPGELIVNPDDPQDIARGLAYALALSPHERSAIADKARVWIVGEHSLEALVEKFVDMLGFGNML